MTLAWVLFLIYMLATIYLGWLGYTKTKGFDSFALGSGDLHPFVVGITMASSVASAATFIINPGFIYAHGLAAFIHLSVAVGIGFCLMLGLLSLRFRQLGEETKALTMPHWIRNRFNSSGLGVFFALVNLFALAFVVLIVGGLSIVMQQLLGLSNVVALIVILGFVTTYVFLGGTYAHVFTNTLQGSLMLWVTLLILVSGIPLFFNGQSGFMQQLGDIDPNLITLINPQSNLYNSIFSVYISGLLIGAALVCQPHILTKALYLKSDKAVRRYLCYGIAILALFFLLPFAGFYARLTIPYDQLLDAGTFRQDLVMTVYIQSAFPDWLYTFVSVVLLAAGMSTLDGILVSLSTITANDLIVPIIERYGKKERTEVERMTLAYRSSHLLLIGIALMAFFICLNPPRLLGIFGQVGVYGMAVAAVPPLLAGILFRNPSLMIIWFASIAALTVHFTLYLWGEFWFGELQLAFANPGVTASLALLIIVIPSLLAVWLQERRS